MFLSNRMRFPAAVADDKVPAVAKMNIVAIHQIRTRWSGAAIQDRDDHGSDPAELNQIVPGNPRHVFA